MANARIGALRVDLGMNTAAFEKGANLAERRLNRLTKNISKMGSRIQSVGKTLTIGLTAPLAFFGTKAAQAAIDAQEMESAFDVVFGKMAGSVRKWSEETGNAMGRSTQEIQRGALAFQELFGKALDPKKSAEMSKSFAILTQDLASFKNLSNEVAQQKLFSGLSGEAEPLRAVGVFLSDAKVQAEALALGLEKVNGKFTEEAKIIARASVIQRELANAQGDVMRTSASTANQIKRSQAAFEELQITLGTKLLPAITPIIEKIGTVLDYFSKLPAPVQTAAVAVGVLAAAIGPLAWGIGGLMVVAPQLVKAFGLMKVAALGLGPAVIPLAAAIGAAYLAWKHWDKIAPALQPLIDQLTAIGEGLGLVEGQAGRTQEELAKDEGWRELGRSIKTATDDIQSFLDAGDAFSQRFAATMRGFWGSIGSGFVNFTETMNSFGAQIKAGFSSLATSAIDSITRLVTGVRSWIVDKLNSVWRGVTDKIDTVKRSFFGLYDAVVGNSYIPDMVDGIAEHMARLDKAMVDPATRAARKTADVMRDLAAEVRGLLDELFPQAAQLRRYRDRLSTIDKGEKAGLLGEDLADRSRNAAMRQLSTVGTGRLEIKAGSGPLVTADKIANQIEEIERRLGLAANRTKTQTVRIAKSFQDMAQETMTALTNMVNAIKGGGFLDILSGIVNLVLQLGSAGLFGKKFAAGVNGTYGGARATGGPVSFGKSYLVGENGPEMFSPGTGGRIIPNHALGGGSTVQIVPSEYFDVVVDGRIIRAAPTIIGAGAAAGVGRMQRMGERRLA